MIIKAFTFRTSKLFSANFYYASSKNSGWPETMFYDKVFNILKWFWLNVSIWPWFHSNRSLLFVIRVNIIIRWSVDSSPKSLILKHLFKKSVKVITHLNVLITTMNKKKILYRVWSYFCLRLMLSLGSLGPKGSNKAVLLYNDLSYKKVRKLLIFYVIIFYSLQMSKKTSNLLRFYFLF